MTQSETPTLHRLQPLLQSGGELRIGDTSCFPLRELGRGKSGISWLVMTSEGERVLKLIHHQPNPYYQFGADKLQCELDAEARLRAIGIPMPRLLCHDSAEEWLLKAYIAGPLASELIAAGELPTECFETLAHLHELCRAAGLNLDWFPANFVFHGQQLYYVDYECNPYSEEWNLPNWGLWYWLNQPGFRRWLKDGEGAHLNRDECGHPVQAGLEEAHAALMQGFFRVS